MTQRGRSNDYCAFRTCYRESPCACIYEERRNWGRRDRMWIQCEASGQFLVRTGYYRRGFSPEVLFWIQQGKDKLAGVFYDFGIVWFWAV